MSKEHDQPINQKLAMRNLEEKGVMVQLSVHVQAAYLFVEFIFYLTALANFNHLQQLSVSMVEMLKFKAKYKNCKS